MAEKNNMCKYRGRQCNLEMWVLLVSLQTEDDLGDIMYICYVSGLLITCRQKE